jgi:lipoprotein-releasing system permease protein
VKVERWLLNFILFFIVAVAGFGILAIFFMIVVEKTKDIGILKALGASDYGVMGVFLSYALVLGVIGCGLGAALGIWFTANINPIERWLTYWTGIEIFPRNLYYFKEIPTKLDLWVVVWTNILALAIAVAASVLPARRAARLRPVEALRYE